MRLHILLFAAIAACSPLALFAQEPRYIQQNGVTYVETPTSATVRRVVPETKLVEREETIYRRETHTEVKEVERRYSVPITEYRREMRWHGVWNPFSQPYMVEHLIPTTRWETRTETVKVPQARVEMIPEKRVRQVPVTTYKEVEVPVVARTIVPPSRTGNTIQPSRAIASPAPRNAIPAKDPFVNDSTAVADNSNRVGGVRRLESDPPRQSSRHDWRPLDEKTKRR